MPEGDTVYRTARRLHAALAAHPLTVCDLRWGDLATVDLTGRDTVEVVSRGKHLLHRLTGGWTIHSHLRMEGSWEVMRAAAASPQRLRAHSVRAVVGTQQWLCLGLRLGMLDVVPTPGEEGLVGHLGPDLLGPDWDAERAVANLAGAPGRPIGEALLDQRNLAGIGTFYDAETLFLEAVGPWTPIGRLADGTLDRIVGRAHRLLAANTEHAVQSTTGSRQRGAATYVHARSGLPCRRCGDTVRVASIGVAPRARTMFYCPTCQGGLAPGDDGRDQRPLGATSRPPGRAGRGADRARGTGR